MATLRVGLLGLGMMGRHHARALRSVPDVDLVAVADPAGDPHGVAAGLEVLTSVQELIAAHIDYAVVAVPTAFHESAAIALADAGIHALIEKPVAPSVAAAQKVASAFESRGLIGAVGHIERFNPALQQLRSRLEAGELGDVYQVATRRQGPFPARIADVGVVMDLASHDIDLTAWVAQSHFISVAANTIYKSGRSHEDLVAVIGKLADGTVTNHLVNWLSPMKERVTIITGARGAFVADTLTADLTFYANGTIETTWESLSSFRGVSEGNQIRYAFSKPEPLLTEHIAFRDAVMGKPSGIVTMYEGLHVVQVAEAILKSADSGKTVDLARNSSHVYA